MIRFESSLRGWRWPLLCALLAFALSLMILANRSSHLLGVPPLQDHAVLTDASAQLIGASACLQGKGRWYGELCFVPDIDSVPRAQAYGLWLGLAELGLDADRHARLLGIAAILMFMLAASFALYPQGLTEAALALALLHTSGVHMAVERGNFDLFMAAMLVAAGALLARSGVLRGVLSISLLALATALKLYTGAACLLAFWVGERLRGRWALLCLLGVVAAIASVGFSEYLTLGQAAPEGETAFSTGARWLWRQGHGGWGVVALVWAAGVFALGVRGLRLEAAQGTGTPMRRAVFELCVLTWLPLFLLKDSYDYRFSLLLPALGYLWVLRGGADGSRSAAILATTALCSYVLASGMQLPLSWTAGFAQPWLADLLLITKQLAAWTLAASLGALLAGLWLERIAALRRRRNRDTLGPV